jgi:hypothetical protein
VSRRRAYMRVGGLDGAKCAATGAVRMDAGNCRKHYKIWEVKHHASLRPTG